MSSELGDDVPTSTTTKSDDSDDDDNNDRRVVSSPWQSWLQAWQAEYGKERQRPPAQVDDFSLLFYDIFLLVNLSVSISFWVVHRMQVDYVALAFNEGCAAAVCWLGAGLGTGAFLDSAPTGHLPDGGPAGAAKLALHTFVYAMNLRLLLALLMAVGQHRAVGAVGGEALLPLELGLGLVLMPAWRLLHASYTSQPPRL